MKKERIHGSFCPVCNRDVSPETYPQMGYCNISIGGKYYSGYICIECSGKVTLQELVDSRKVPLFVSD
jgi:hypothetical protein